MFNQFGTYKQFQLFQFPQTLVCLRETTAARHLSFHGAHRIPVYTTTSHVRAWWTRGSSYSTCFPCCATKILFSKATAQWRVSCIQLTSSLRRCRGPSWQGFTDVAFQWQFLHLCPASCFQLLRTKQNVKKQLLLDHLSFSSWLLTNCWTHF